MAMSEEHKAALAQGRRESRLIKRYLEALAAKRPGRPVTAESLKAKIERLEGRIATESDPLKKLSLIQEKIAAEERLESIDETLDMVALERDFVEVAKSYSERKGISYSAWRELGVPAEVLRRAGIPRTRRTS